MNFSCPKCGHGASAPDVLGAKRVRCSKCGHRFYPLAVAAETDKADASLGQLAGLEKDTPAAAEPVAHTGAAAIWFSLPTVAQYGLVAACVLFVLAAAFAVVWKATDGFGGGSKPQIVRQEPPPAPPPPANPATAALEPADWHDAANKELDLIQGGIQGLKKAQETNVKLLAERTIAQQQAIEQAKARAKTAAQKVEDIKTSLADMDRQEKTLRLEAENRQVRRDATKSLMAAADKDIANLDTQLRKAADPAKRAELAGEQLVNRKKRQALEKDLAEIAKGEGKLEALLSQRSALAQGLTVQEAMVQDAERAVALAKAQLDTLDQLRQRAARQNDDLDQRYRAAVESFNNGQRPRDLPAIRVQIESRQADQADLLKLLPAAPTTQTATAN